MRERFVPSISIGELSLTRLPDCFSPESDREQPELHSRFIELEQAHRSIGKRARPRGRAGIDESHTADNGITRDMRVPEDYHVNVPEERRGALRARSQPAVVNNSDADSVPLEALGFRQTGGDRAAIHISTNGDQWRASSKFAVTIVTRKVAGMDDTINSAGDFQQRPGRRLSFAKMRVGENENARRQPPLLTAASSCDDSS